MTSEFNRKRVGSPLESDSKRRALDHKDNQSEEIEDRFIEIEKRIDDLEGQTLELDEMNSSINNLKSLECRVSNLEMRFGELDYLIEKKFELFEERIDELESESLHMNDLDRDVFDLKNTQCKKNRRYYSSIEECAKSIFPKETFVGFSHQFTLSSGIPLWEAYYWLVGNDYYLMGTAQIIQTLHGFCQYNTSEECGFNFEYILSNISLFESDERVTMFQKMNSFLFKNQLLVDKTKHLETCTSSKFPRFTFVDGIFCCLCCEVKMDIAFSN